MSKNRIITICVRKLLQIATLVTRCVTGADPGFFLGGGALVSCSTSTPINHSFFFAEYQLYQKTAGHLGGGGGGVRTPAPSPQIRRCVSYYKIPQNDKKNLLKFVFLSAGDSPVTREVLQHMYNSLVEQVKRKVERLSFTVKNLTVGFLPFTMANQSVHGLGK